MLCFHIYSPHILTELIALMLYQMKLYEIIVIWIDLSMYYILLNS